MNEAKRSEIMADGKKCPQCGASLPAGALDGLCPACLLKQGATAETGTPTPGAPFQPPDMAEVARLFPQLEILAFAGRGGMGAVYKARQPALDRLVALKILSPQAAAGSGFAERFNREARALAKLNHPNIVAVHEFGQTGRGDVRVAPAGTSDVADSAAPGMPFFIMEFVDGLTLRQLERAGGLSPREALQIVPQICEALQFAHDEGVVHRDIKPENILLDKKGRVKIADFGIAKIMGTDAGVGQTFLSAGSGDFSVASAGAPNTGLESPANRQAGKPAPPSAALTGEKQAIGTPHYMAPEQVEKPQTVDHRADIYSLGVVFYEMLTGELPLGKFAPPSRKVEVDVRLDEVVLRALEKEPELRYQHASVLKTDVETIVSTPEPSSRREEAQTEFAKPSQSWGTWSPFQSPEVRDICAHLTKAERNQVSLLGLLSAVWIVATCFGIPALIRSSPGLGNWIVASVWGILFVVTIPMLQRMVRQFLCSTGWARENGFTPENLRLFSFRGGNLWKGIAVLAVVLLLILAQHKAIISYLGLPDLSQRQKTNTAGLHPPRQSRTAITNALASFSFGPVIERVMKGSGEKTGFQGLDFESGNLWTATAKDLSGDGLPKQWIADHDIDLLAAHKGGAKWELGALQTQLAFVPEERWQSASLDELRRALGEARMEDQAGWRSQTVRSDGEKPLTFALQTGSGAIGLLQITGFTDKPRGVRIRYKLVQTNNPVAGPMSEPSDLREARAKLAEGRVDYAEQHPAVQRAMARVRELERLTREEPSAPADLREAKAHLAELRVDCAEAHPLVQNALARLQELERLTREEPSAPADWREAKAHLAELRVRYRDKHPVVQEALARIKELERLTREEASAPAELREAKAHLAELRARYREQHPVVQEALARVKALEGK